MPITLHDRAPLEKVRRLADGRLTAVARFARSGCQTYAGHEVSRPDLPTVTVYRPEAEVFSADAMASFAHKTITVGHPAGSVTADNWKQHAAGWTEGKVARDGEFVEIPLMLADASAVAAFDAGTKELSAGYSCELVWGDCIAPDGTRAHATQTNIRGNHIALVPAGRAGGECRIGDSAMYQDAQITAAVERERTIHDARFAFMGAHAPAFDEGRALFLARNASSDRSAQVVRDLAYGGQHAPQSDSTLNRAVADARAETIADLKGDNHRSVRDLARGAQY